MRLHLRLLLGSLANTLLHAQRCHWSDMFTGRLRSEIPPALVRTRLCFPMGPDIPLYLFPLENQFSLPGENRASPVPALCPLQGMGAGEDMKEPTGSSLGWEEMLLSGRSQSPGAPGPVSLGCHLYTVSCDCPPFFVTVLLSLL